MASKLFVGPRLRRYRERKGLSQIDFARTLDISASYLNQIENNQRPLTAAVLLKLGASHDVDLQSLSDDEDLRLAGEMRDAMADPVFGGGVVDLRELKEIVSLSPDVSRRFLSLYRAWRSSQVPRLDTRRAELGELVLQTDDPQFAYDEVRDFFHLRDNYLDELDVAAESFVESESLRIGHMHDGLVGALVARHGVRVELAGAEAMSNATSRYDSGAQVLRIAAELSASRRAYQLAVHFGRLELGTLFDEIIASAAFVGSQTAAVCRRGLANYFAAALLLPYRRFLAAAEHCRYDIERLEQRFATSFETVCHRLSSLQRPNHKGVPFYFVRVDRAGNISKRQCTTDFSFARSGGACPLWNVHEAFASPGRFVTQIARMPDSRTYFCIARTDTKQVGGYLDPQRHFSIGVGCEIQYAKELVYATGIDVDNADAVVPIGPSCRLCSREACPQRACPPLGRQLEISEQGRFFEPYRFR